MHPLDGITVVECGVAVAGPTAARVLGHLGADVIKVENRSDRTLAHTPWWAPPDIGLAGLDLPPGPLNAEKRHLGLDLKAPEGKAALARVIANSDVFVANLSVPAIESLGLTYAELRTWNPRIVYISMPGFGDGPGPYRQYRSWGPNLSALSGLDYMTGDPDRSPIMAPLPYPDWVCGYHAVVAVLDALLQRAHTGQGQEIKMAQFETTVSLLGPEILQAQLTGDVPIRSGNRHPIAAPRALLPCRGDDRWVSIEVFNDDEWQALCGVPGVPAALHDERFRSHAGRLTHQDAIEAILGGWTQGFSSRDVALLLQEHGVAACPVLNNWDPLADPHIEARGFWRVVGHDRLGVDLTASLPIRFSLTPASYTRAAPSFGHDTEAILAEKAGLSNEEIQALIEANIAQLDAPLPGHITPEMLERPSRRWAWPLLHVLDHVDDIVEPDVSLDPNAPALDLTQCRVLDLSDDLSAYGTKLLAMLGADVVRVEPPGGSGVRCRPPLYDGRSPFQQYMDAGKRSVTIERLTTEAGRSRFEELVRGADVIYESLRPGELARLGMGWERIHELNPRAVLVSATPFGQGGPYSRWNAGELGLWALSGALPSVGYPDVRPNVPASLVYFWTGLMGCIGALASLYARNRTGLGQWVEVSAHETLVATAGGMLNQIEDMAERPRNGVRSMGSAPYGFFTCKDRLINLLALMPQHWKALSDWIYERTGNPEALDERFQGAMGNRYRHLEAVERLVNSLSTQYGADEFCREAQARGIPAMPVNSIADLLADPHLAATGYWQPFDYPGKGQIRWPGPPFRLQGMRPPSPAPEPGQHTAELLGVTA